MSDNNRHLIIDQLKELREAINQSSDHTKKQVESIETNLYIGAILSLIFTFGLSYIFQIFVYWIPSGFILFLIWALISLFKSSKTTLDSERSKERIIVKIDTSKFFHGLVFLIKNIMPFAKATSLIYGISFILIVILKPDWLDFNNLYSIIPLITCLIWLPAPFYLDNLIASFKKGDTVRILHESNLKSRNKEDYIYQIGGFVVWGLICFLLVILPLLSLWIIYPFLSPISEKISHLFPVIIL